MPRKNVPPHADIGRALQQLRAARGVTQEDMLSTTTRAQQVQTERWIQESSPLPADLYAAHTVRSIHSHLFSPWDHEDGGGLPPGAPGGTNKAISHSSGF